MWFGAYLFLMVAIQEVAYADHGFPELMTVDLTVKREILYKNGLLFPVSVL